MGFITIPDMGKSVYVSETDRTLSEDGASAMKGCRLPKDSVMMSCIATVGKCGITAKDSFTNQQINSVICDAKKVYPPYLYYAFTQLGHKLDIAGGGGSVYTNVSKSRFSDISITLPPLSEQRRIAGILGSLDDKIELNRRMSKTLEAISQAIFKSWFIDFDPVIDNALAAGNEIPEALRARAKARQTMGDKRQPLPPSIHSLFPAEFEITPQGPIPKGWKITTVGEVIRIIGGKTPSTKNESYWSNGIHAFCTPRDMSKLSTTILLDTERSITDDAINSTNSELLPAGTALMSSRAPIGHLAITDIPVIINQGIIAFERQDKFSEMYLLSWIIFNMEKILEKANGSVFLEINKQNFRSISFLLPADKILDSFNRQVNTMQTRLASCARNMKKLSGTRDALLPKLISQIY